MPGESIQPNNQHPPKQPKKLQKQSPRKTEPTKVKAIMEQLYKSDGNIYKSRYNIDHFTPIYESDYEEGTNHMTKPNTPIIVLSKEEKGRKNKINQNKGNEEDEKNRENKTIEKVYQPDSDNELNG